MTDSPTPLSSIIAARTAVSKRGYARDPELAEAATAMVAAALADPGEDTTDAASLVLAVARKARQAAAAYTSVAAEATKLALIATPAKAWAEYAMRLAEAEGVTYAWAHLDVAVTYAVEHSVISRALIVDVALHLLAAGADDEWSGRVNDVQRARFDGIREACAAMQWLS